MHFCEALTALCALHHPRLTKASPPLLQALPRLMRIAHTVWWTLASLISPAAACRSPLVWWTLASGLVDARLSNKPGLATGSPSHRLVDPRLSTKPCLATGSPSPHPSMAHPFRSLLVNSADKPEYTAVQCAPRQLLPKPPNAARTPLRREGAVQRRRRGRPTAAAWACAAGHVWTAPAMHATLVWTAPNNARLDSASNARYARTTRTRRVGAPPSHPQWQSPPPTTVTHPPRPQPSQTNEPHPGRASAPHPPGWARSGGQGASRVSRSRRLPPPVCIRSGQANRSASDPSQLGRGPVLPRAAPPLSGNKVGGRARPADRRPAGPAPFHASAVQHPRDTVCLTGSLAADDY